MLKKTVFAAAALARFVGEFDSLRALYADYKRQAALLYFDDLLHHARDLLAGNTGVRQALARRYPRLRLAPDQHFTFHPNISFRGPQVLTVQTGQ